MKMILEKVSADDQASFRCLEWDEPDFDCPHHFHPEIEITHILASSGERLVGDRFDTFSPGDLAMFGSNLPHRYRNWKSGRAHSRVVQFRLDVLGDTFSLPECRRIRLLIQESAGGLQFSESTRREGCRLIARLFKAPPGPRRLGLLLELLDLFSRDDERRRMASHGFMAPENPEQSKRLERVLNHIDAHWKEKLSLAEVAKVACLHPQSLSRYFRKRLGKTFQEYLIELRLSRASRNLLETENTVVEIAFESGFNNLANFNRQFQKVYHKTPTEYRRHA